jgi:hypothetical protein
VVQVLSGLPDASCFSRVLLLQMAPVDYAQEGHRLLQLIQQKA